MIVMDASVLGPLLLDEAVERKIRVRIDGHELVARELVDVEVTAILRKRHRTKLLSQKRAMQALVDLRDLPVERLSHRPLIGRMWELRDNVTPYDAAYVAVAELYDATVLTADTRLANASGPRCHIEVLA